MRNILATLPLRRHVLGVPLASILLGLALLAALLWGAWATRALIELKNRELVTVQLSALVGEFVEAEARAGGDAEVTQRRIAQLNEDIDQLTHQASVLNARVAEIQDLGVALDGLGRFTEAGEDYERSLAIREQVLGAQHPQVGAILARLGGAMLGSDRLLQADATFVRARWLLDPLHITDDEQSLPPPTMSAWQRRELATVLDRQGEGRIAVLASDHAWLWSRGCEGCVATSWVEQPEPELVDNREQVLDPMTAYQITSMMEGVVTRGTAVTVSELGRPIAGKTGTTNDEKDAWFVGYTPDLVVGVYLGYDTPRPMGKGSTGGGLAAPIFKAFMAEVLKDKRPVDFRVPEGMKLIAIDRKTGMRSKEGAPGSIMEAFKPGTGPSDTYSVIGMEDIVSQERAKAISPQANRAITTGKGGLF